MELKDKKNNDVKKGRLDSGEIYDKNRDLETPKERWAKMSKKERFQYFKEYYLKYVIIAAVVLFALVFFGIQLFKPDKKDSFYCAMLNGSQFDHDTMESMPSDFADYLSKDSTFEGYINKDRMDISSYYNTITDQIKIDNFFDQKKFDVFISNEGTFKSFATTQTCMELDELLPESIYNKLKDKLVYATKKDSDKEYPYGISLEGCGRKFYDGSGAEIDPPILSVSYTTKRPETAIAFIKYIFNITE